MKKVGIIIILFISLLAFGMRLIPQERNNDLSTQPETGGYSVEELPNGTYRCCFYGKDGVPLRSEESARLPHVDVLPSGYIRYTVQAGTGVGTLWGFFFDRNQENFSESFTAILDQKDNFVALATAKGIVIRSIFDDSYYKEITHFSQEFASAAMPLFDAAFSEKEGVLSVSYYSGADYHIVTEEIKF